MSDTDDTAAVALTVIRTGEIPTPYGYVFRPTGNPFQRLRHGLRAGDDALLSPCLAFVIRHPSAGLILVDTGFTRETSSHLRHEFGVPMNLLFRGLRPARQGFDSQLREHGVDPADVQTVVMTHLHVDHTGGMNLLPNARFTISETEWNATRGRFAAYRGYARHHLPPAERVAFVDLEGAGEAWGPFSRTLDLLGDGTIRLISTPGHTKGHLSLLLRTTGGVPVLVVGDAAYTVRSIREGLLPLLTDSDRASTRSLGELKAFIDREPTAIVVPSHDPDAYRSLDAISVTADRSEAPLDLGQRTGDGS